MNQLQKDWAKLEAGCANAREAFGGFARAIESTPFERTIKVNAPQGQIDRWHRKRHRADLIGWRYVHKGKPFCRKAKKWDAIHDKFSAYASGF